jgi:hypothetical protein
MSVAGHELLFDSWVDNKARDRLESGVAVWQPVEFVVPASGLTAPTEALVGRWTGVAAGAGDAVSGGGALSVAQAPFPHSQCARPPPPRPPEWLFLAFCTLCFHGCGEGGDNRPPTSLGGGSTPV